MIIEIVIILIAGFLVHQYNKHYIATKDSSLKGFIEYLKEKYWSKEDKS